MSNGGACCGIKHPHNARMKAHVSFADLEAVALFEVRQPRSKGFTEGRVKTCAPNQTTSKFRMDDTQLVRNRKGGTQDGMHYVSTIRKFFPEHLQSTHVVAHVEDICGTFCFNPNSEDAVIQ